MTRTPKSSATASRFILIVILLLGTFLGACRDRFDKDDEDKAAKSANPATPPAAQISFENGQTILTLDQQTQTRMGLEIAVLAATATRARASVPAVVLSVQDLATFRNGYITIMSQIEKDRVDIDVAQKEYARAKMLFDSDRNISEKTLQSTEGTLRSLEADERAAQLQLNLQASMAQQQWGSVAGKWAVDGSPELESFLTMREILLQITLPIDQTYVAPKSISVEIPGRKRSTATLVSPFTRVDPRIQGRSFLYMASAQPEFVPGANLLALIEIGNQIRGVIMPTPSVVWSEGRSWVYLQTAANQFSRREVATEIPVDGGYLVSAGFPTGSKVVTRGAQSLLSEESVLQGYGGGETDTD